MKNMSIETGRKQAALDYLSGQIDIWNRTATAKKKIITTWRKRVFILILMGTFFGLLSQFVSTIEELRSTSFIEIHEIFAIISAISIALSSFAATQILTSDLEKSQIKARSTAESLKVQAFLYLMNANPFGRKNPEKILYERIEMVLRDVEDITPVLNKKGDKNSFLNKILKFVTVGRLGNAKKKEEWIQTFDVNMTFEEYFNQRVKGQIDGYYLKKAAHFQKIINRGNSFCVVFGFLGVAIGTIAATVSAGASMWIAFLSTASASIGSYLHANKYEYLMLSYVSTASQLELISAKHQSFALDSEKAKRKFVSETEAIFAMEHNAWISEVAGLKDEDIVNEEEEETTDKVPLAIS